MYEKEKSNLDQDILSKILLEAMKEPEGAPKGAAEVTPEGMQGLETVVAEDESGMVRTVPKELGDGSMESAIMAVKAKGWKDPRSGKDLDRFASIVDAAQKPILSSPVPESSEQDRIESAAGESKDVTTIDTDESDPRDLVGPDEKVITGSKSGEITVEGVLGDKRALMLKKLLLGI